MKHRCLILSAGLMALILAGCFKVEETIKVNPDGTGTIERTIGISNNLIKMLKDLDKASGKESPSFDDKKYEDELKEMGKEMAQQRGEGVEFKNVKKETKDNMRCFTLFFSFKDITKILPDVSELLEPPSVISKQPGGKKRAGSKKRPIRFGFTKLPDGTAELTLENPWGQGLKEKIKEPIKTKAAQKTDKSGKPDQIDPDEKKIQDLIKELCFSFNLVCGSQIIEAQATHRKNNRITLMEIDYRKLSRDEKKFNQLMEEYPELPDDPAEASKIILKTLGKADGYKIELEDTITIKFK
jgi:hypothetical protein